MAARLDRITGVVVRSYSDEASPAKVAGVEPGDVIIAADGKPTDRVSTLQRIVRAHKPGETLSFDVMRFGSRKSFRVKLGEAPDSVTQVASTSGGSRDGSASEGRRFDKVGITVEPVSPEVVRGARLTEAVRKGLIVSDVSVTGPAYRKLYADQTIVLSVINPGPKRELHSAADLDAVLSKLNSGDLLTLMVYDIGGDGSTRAITLQVH